MLAFRFSCINANACKECMMLIDGKVGYACTVRLKEGVTNLAPLPKNPDPGYCHGNRAAGRTALIPDDGLDLIKNLI